MIINYEVPNDNVHCVSLFISLSQFGQYRFLLTITNPSNFRFLASFGLLWSVISLFNTLFHI